MSIFIQTLMAMIPTDEGQKCTKCGWFKRKEEFYSGLKKYKRKSGIVIAPYTRTECKECCRKAVNFDRKSKCANNAND